MIFGAAILVALAFLADDTVRDLSSSKDTSLGRHALAVSPKPWDTMSDTWAATDALGRKLPGYDEVGPPRKDRFVGVFYFLWHGPHVNGGPYDITQILAKDPTAIDNSSSPLWGPMYAPHHWGQPLFGYYLSDDEYVIRKHAQMLSDAGVDVIVFDVTNELTYKHYYMKLLEVFSEIRALGGKTPQVAFLCPFWDPSPVVKELCQDLYEPGLYEDLWFKWKGKPLILADRNFVATHTAYSDYVATVDIKPGHTLAQSFSSDRGFDFVGARAATDDPSHFSVTLSLLRGGPNGRKITSRLFNGFPTQGWLALDLGRSLPPGDYTVQMSDVKGGVAWWADKNAQGPSFANGAPFTQKLAVELGQVMSGGKRLSDFFTFRKPQPDYFQGPTQPDMWSWLETYPQHVFLNDRAQKEEMSIGVAQNAVRGRLGAMSEPGAQGRNWHHGANDETPGAIDLGLNFAEQAQRVLKEDPEFAFITNWNEWIAGRFPPAGPVKVPVVFVDEFTQEFSRDVEPMLGGHEDDYYYQMVDFIRRFKGVRKPPEASRPKTIDIAGDFSQWRDVAPEYRDDVGDEARRDHEGWNHVARYVNSSGRNDFVAMKVVHDSDFVYFYVRTREAISPRTDPHWMMLFIQVQGSGPNWEGYQFLVNSTVESDVSTELAISQGGWSWKEKAKVRYRVQGNELQLAIRRSDLVLQGSGKPLTLQFKWMDNMQREGDAMEFTTDGDAAPDGRFNYLYTLG